MKKKSLFFLALTVWVLAACTLLSGAISTLMRPRVTYYAPPADASSASKGWPTPIEALQYDSDGVTHVYAITTGTGWESGLLAEEVDPQNYSVNYKRKLVYTSERRVILSYTKPFRSGDLIIPVSGSTYNADHYLVFYPAGVPAMAQLPDGMDLAAAGEGSLLLSVPRAPQPFMELTAIRTLAAWEDAASGDDPALAQKGVEKNIYSLLAVRQFLSQLPLLALVALLLLYPPVLWCFSASLLSAPRRQRPLLLVNAALGALSLVLLALALGRLELPASLLPRANIFDLGHYVREFSQILSALGRFPQPPQILQDTLSAASGMGRAALAILLAGVAGLIAILFLEAHIRRRCAARTAG